jgi:membrane protease YdiL (CAAX protease family)
VSISAKALSVTLVYLFVAVTAASVLAWLLTPLLDYSYLKILSRGVLLFLAIGLIPVWRMAGLSAVGIGLSPVRVKNVIAAYPVGIALLLPVMLFFLVVEYRVWDDRVDYAGLEFWRFFVLAIGSGLLVGVFEETLFRGVLFSALRRVSSFAVSTGVVAVLYASVHFLSGSGQLAPTHVPVQEWYSGYGYVIHAFSGLADPLESMDSFIALFLLGGLLCWVRERAGLWWCIGLHAAWVFAIRCFKEMTVRDVHSPYEVWASSYDSFVGHLVSVWLVFILLVLWLYRQSKQT